MVEIKTVEETILAQIYSKLLVLSEEKYNQEKMVC